jgi:hypothetical protein
LTVYSLALRVSYKTADTWNSYPKRLISFTSKNVLTLQFYTVKPRFLKIIQTELKKKKGIPFFLIIAKENFIIFSRRCFLLLSGGTPFSKFNDKACKSVKRRLINAQ